MSYRNDQWHNLIGEEGEIVASGKNDAGYYITEADNDRFIYPTRRVRTLGTGTGVQGNATVPNSTTLKRGYIRSLLKESGASRKCQFQFNPASINQSVSQNSSILNFLQSDPAQYVQPIPGNVTFQFSTFFDRTMEVVNGVEPVREALRLRADNPWETASPGTVGVLHDLASLFSIIGVGVSEYMSNKLSQGVEDNEASFFNTETIRAFASEDDDLTVDQFMDSFNDLVAVNKGNSAFLLPLPVRIVFSSLYIVEGMVKDIDVLYQKFSTNMVPIQARVDITLEAKYIGFAKKDTFFTNALADLSRFADEQSAVRNAGSFGEIDPEYVDAMNSDFGKVELFVVSDNKDDGSDFDGIRKNGYPDKDHRDFNRMISAPLPQQYNNWFDSANEDFDDGNGSLLGGEVAAPVANEKRYALHGVEEPEGNKQAPEVTAGSRTPKHIRLEFPNLQNNVVAGLIASGTNVSIEVSAQVHCYRFLQPESVLYLDNILNTEHGSSNPRSVTTENYETLTRPPSGGKQSIRYDAWKFDNASQARKLLDKVAGNVIGGKRVPETTHFNEDTSVNSETSENPNEVRRIYESSKRLWSLSLDSTNLLVDYAEPDADGDVPESWQGINTITTVDDIERFRAHKVNSKGFKSATDDRSKPFLHTFNDGSTQQCKTVETHHQGAYYILFATVVNATIGSSTAQKSAVYVRKYPNLKNVEQDVDGMSANSLFDVSIESNFDWSSPVDDDTAVPDNSDTGSTSNESPKPPTEDGRTLSLSTPSGSGWTHHSDASGIDTLDPASIAEFS